MRTITLCSGKGGVGKTLLAASLGRVMSQKTSANVLLVDGDFSTRGLTLLAFPNLHQFNQVPVSLSDFLCSQDGDDAHPPLFSELQRGIGGNDATATPDADQPVPYRYAEGLFVLPFSTENERPDWERLHHLSLEDAVHKLGQLQDFAVTSLDVDYLIFDTQAGLGSLSLAAAVLSDVNIIMLEEDNVSWRASLSMYMEISDLNRRLRRRTRSYFLANKVSRGMLDVSEKLRAFSFLPAMRFDTWMHELYSHDSACVSDEAFESTDFFRWVESELWPRLAVMLGVQQLDSRPAARSVPWWAALKSLFIDRVLRRN